MPCHIQSTHSLHCDSHRLWARLQWNNSQFQFGQHQNQFNILATLDSTNWSSHPAHIVMVNRLGSQLLSCNKQYSAVNSTHSTHTNLVDVLRQIYCVSGKVNNPSTALQWLQQGTSNIQPPDGVLQIHTATTMIFNVHCSMLARVGLFPTIKPLH